MHSPSALPPPDSAWPSDIALRQAVYWTHSVNLLCPTCHGPRLVGFLDGEIVGFACHKCGPSEPKGNASDHY